MCYPKPSITLPVSITGTSPAVSDITAHVIGGWLGRKVRFWTSPPRSILDHFRTIVGDEAAGSQEIDRVEEQKQSSTF